MSRTRNAIATFLVLLLCFGASSAFALSPDEMLTSPVLEKRARTISAQVRCMVCQNESIDDSNADLARDLRVLVRERLMAGDTDQQVLDFLVARYGEFVLLKPRLRLSTVVLWGFPIGALLIGALALVVSARRRRIVSIESGPLSDVEKQQLKKLVGTLDN